MQQHQIAMLGTGLIGDFYSNALHAQRSRDRVRVVYSRSDERGRAFRERWDIPDSTTDMKSAIEHPDVDVVVIGVPNFLHEEAVSLAAQAGKAVLCTKPLGRNAEEAARMLAMVEQAGVFGGYLEDLCYTPKTSKAIRAVQAGTIGEVTWVRSREAHPGPHSAWFWDGRLTGGGAIVDLGCHCIEIIRNYVGKGNRPLEVLCHADTLVHPIGDEDNAVALIRFESGALGQFEVSWTFRGGMDLRDEVAGTEGTIWVNNFLRTGFEMFSAGGSGGYVSEKCEADRGWMFPVGDEAAELGYIDMFTDMFRSIESGTRAARDVLRRLRGQCRHGRRVPLGRVARLGARPAGRVAWRHCGAHRRGASHRRCTTAMVVIKREILPDGRHKLILKDPASGDYSDRVVAAPGSHAG